MSSLSAADVRRLQAARLTDAMLSVASERGLTQTTVEAVIERATISRRTFYEVFPSKEVAFDAALELSIERSMRRVRAACARYAGQPAAAARAGLEAFVAEVRAAPGRARLCVTETYNRPGSGLARRALDWFERIVLEFDLGPALAPLPRGDLVGATCGIVISRLDSPRPALGSLLPALSVLLFTESASLPDLGRPSPEPDDDALLPPAICTAVREGAAPQRHDVDRLHQLMIDAAVHEDAATLRALCRLIDEVDVHSLELERATRARLDELAALSRAALAGGTASLLALAGFVRPRDEDALSGRLLRGLTYLGANEVVAPGDLRTALAIRHPSQVSRLLAELAERGLAERSGRNGDPRVWRITAAGRSMLARAGRP